MLQFQHRGPMPWVPTLLDAALKGTVILALAGAATLLLRRSSAGVMAGAPAAGPVRAPLGSGAARDPSRQGVEMGKLGTSPGDGNKARGKPVDAEDHRIPWGPAVEGVRCRLRPPRDVLRPGDPLDLEAELRNAGPKQWTRVTEPPNYRIELDGEWFHWVGQTSADPFPRARVPRQPQRLSVHATWAWRDVSGDWLGAPDPGKHVVRVAFCLDPRDAAQSSIRVVSNPVSIEIVPGEDPAPQQAWGGRVEGVQLRLRAEKRARPADAVATLKLDARNRGRRELHFFRAEPMCEIQLDGQWYTWAGSPSLKSSWFAPGMSYYGVAVSLGRKWRSKADATPLTLGPGSHTVRVACRAFPLDAKDPGSRGPVRAISNPVDVRVVPAQAAAQPTRGAGLPRAAVRGSSTTGPLAGR